MTLIALPHAHFDPQHLAEVTAAMAELGAPTLRAVDMGSYVQLLEGSHRARAALALGLGIELDLVDEQDLRASEDAAYPVTSLCLYTTLDLDCDIDTALRAPDADQLIEIETI